MNDLNDIASSQFADDVFDKIDENFDDVKSAIDTLEQSGGGGGGTSTGLEKVFVNDRVANYKGTIKVLALGNSYAQNSLAYIGDFLDAASAQGSEYYVKTYRPPGQSLSGWWSIIGDNAYSGLDPVTRGSASMSSAATTGFRGELSKDWDIVSIQQNSDNVANYSTYEPYITDIISAIRYHCVNKNVKIALHMVWDKSIANNACDTHLSDIIAATQAVCRKNKIDIVVPTGIAIANARKAFSGNTMMRDTGGHLAYGVARYVAAATWYQAVFKAFCGTDLSSLEVLHPMGNTYDGVTESATNDNDVAVTASNMVLCQQCAIDAVNNMWKVSNY